jgi:hypothetical protein
VADETQVKILIEKGVEAWNKWRKANPETRPDLSAMNLYHVDLSGANLSRADLTGATFSGVTLRRANLRTVDLYRANLRGANLSWADLTKANLRGANLRGANLRTADFFRANLNEANLLGTNLGWAQFRGGTLQGVNLSGALLDGTTFADVDLSQVKGLETVKHDGPSEISISTIYRSKGKIPFEFLRGAGVPDNFIEYMHSLVGKAFEFYSCFISYSFKDQPFAERLHADLQANGVRCWFAPHHGQAGQKLHEQIDQAIRVHEKLLLILSTDSMKSEWVKTEIKKAAKRQKQEKKDVLFPVSLAPFDELREWECFDGDLGKDLGAEIREYLIPDFSRWKEHDPYQKAFAKLLRDLRSGKTKTG